MSRNLYETLGVSPNATTEDIRRAYRRKALETHPDRLPQGASAAEKAVSEELFRKVNNAYEVLSDPQSRNEYDQYGAWPPQAPQQNHHANGSYGPFEDPFYRDPFSQPFFRNVRMDPFNAHPHAGFRGFTDPFVLFNSIFGDLHRAFESDPFFDAQFGRPVFGSSPLGGGMIARPFPSMLPFDGFGGNGMGSSRMQMFSGNGNDRGRWVAQSWSSSTVNGVTHTKSVHKDSEGNEHVLYRYPDGTERRTINGVEQSSTRPLAQRALPAPSAPPVPSGSYPARSGAVIPSLPPPYTDVGSRPSKHVHYEADKHSYRQGHGSKDSDRYGYRNDGHGHGHEPQGSSTWKFYK